MDSNQPLDDSAEIYQQREEKPQKILFREMTRQQKIEHFNYYYRKKCILGLFALFCVISIIVTILTPSKEYSLNIAVINNCLTKDATSDINTRMKKYLKVDSSLALKIDSSFDFLNPDTSYANENNLFVQISVGSIDVIIASEDTFKVMIENRFLSDLSTVLPSDLLNECSDHLLYYQPEEESKESAYGVYVDNYKVTSSDGDVLSNPVIGIISNTKHQKNCINLIKALVIDP